MQPYKRNCASYIAAYFLVNLKLRACYRFPLRLLPGKKWVRHLRRSPICGPISRFFFGGEGAEMTSFLLFPQLASKRVGVRTVLGVSEAGLSTYSMHTVSAECTCTPAQKGERRPLYFAPADFSPLALAHTFPRCDPITTTTCPKLRMGVRQKRCYPLHYFFENLKHLFQWGGRARTSLCTLWTYRHLHPPSES